MITDGGISITLRFLCRLFIFGPKRSAGYMNPSHRGEKEGKGISGRDRGLRDGPSPAGGRS